MVVFLYSMKKKIIIFTSSGGNGHVSATKALQSYLSDDYELKPVYIFEELFGGIEPISLLTMGRKTGEDVYNFFLKRRYYRVLNAIYDCGKWYFALRKKSMVRIISAYLASQKPDLIISVIPVVNDAILHAAHLNKIPFLLIPTDFDVTTFIRGMNPTRFGRCRIALGCDSALVRAPLIANAICSSKIAITGLPMRKDFFEPKDIPSLKHEYGIPEQKPVIMVMMGGQGAMSIIAFAQQLARLEIPAHLFFCIGKNKSLEASLKNMVFASHLTISIQGFTERISDLLAIADILITKSGSVSFAEGITMNVPMILDATAHPLYWERLNHTMLTENNWGICLKRMKDLNDHIRCILANRKVHQTMKNNLGNFAGPRLDQEIKALIENLLALPHEENYATGNNRRAWLAWNTSRVRRS